MNEKDFGKCDREPSDFEQLEITVDRVFKVSVNVAGRVNDTFNLIQRCKDGDYAIDKKEEGTILRDNLGTSRMNDVDIILRNVELQLEIINKTNLEIAKLFEYENLKEFAYDR